MVSLFKFQKSYIMLKGHFSGRGFPVENCQFLCIFAHKHIDIPKPLLYAYLVWNDKVFITVFYCVFHPLIMMGALDLKVPKNPLRAMALTSAIVSQLAGGPLAGAFLGKWLDEQFAVQPLFLILGIFLGVGAGTYGTIHLVREYTGDE